MSLELTNKLNYLLQNSQEGKLFFSKWLNKIGYSDQLLSKYRQSGWLVSISKGVMSRNNKTLNAVGAISSMNEQLEKSYAIAAHSALELAGFSHFIPMGKPTLMIRRKSNEVVPTWMKECEFNRNLYFFTCEAFLYDATHIYDDGNFQTLTSSAEQAFLECLILAPKYYTFMDLYYIMEQMTTLRIDVMQKLLEGTTNNKVKRMFLYMASKANHYWFSKLDLTKIELGSGKYNLHPGGVYIPQYKITIPKELYDYE
ncbi:MAG: type IV toxin-antitoxin system AbiEi family antitoxin domain-containing protein [Rikenellaceae bacterium]